MDLFEVLFILLFILFPIIEQARKKGKGQGGPGGKQGPGPGSGRSGTDLPRSGSGRGASEPGQPRPTSRSGQGEPGTAADMVPDDLWSILTGETRSRAPADAGAGTADEDAPWSEAADRRSWEPDDPVEPAAPDLEPDLEPVSLEYEGPEAYSLERTDFEAKSLERTDLPATSLERTDYRPLERRVPDAATRHRAFHDFIDRPKPTRRGRRSSVGRALRDPDSLRNAFVLSEVLGKPKGLED